jgi:hypothetical protein
MSKILIYDAVSSERVATVRGDTDKELREKLKKAAQKISKDYGNSVTEAKLEWNSKKKEGRILLLKSDGTEYCEALYLSEDEEEEY